MSKKYIDNIKDLIKQETDQHARQNKVTREFVDDAFILIKPKIRVLETLVWVSPAVDDETLRAFFETAKKEYLSIHPIKIDPSSSLTKEGFETWLTEERDTLITWNYLDRYLHHLNSEGRSETVILETERSSRDIVGKLGDPESNTSFFVKGLVVGEVQSGKTANFNAVINRAIDAGYQLIIVLSGIMEDLRIQTQDRVEGEVVGWGSLPDSAQNGRKGVGLRRHFGMTGDDSVTLIESITSCSTDFSGALLKGSAALNSPKILVCKKNVSILRNIINWLFDLLQDEDKYHSIPFLILDDEADNASLNNEGAKGREYASKINGHIRAILAMFQKKSYLGYTATPFANVLQDHNDPAEIRWPVKSVNGERTFEQVENLFPDDFIVLLESPSNYIGAKQIFETIAEIPKLPVVTAVDDFVSEFPTRLLRLDGKPVKDFPTKVEWDNTIGEFGSYYNFTSHSEYRRGTRASKPDDEFPASLPRSLKDAVLCFILSVAVRESRKAGQTGSSLYEPHNSMLVHISRFTTWQNRTTELIKEHVEYIVSRIENDKPEEMGSVYNDLENLWNIHFADIIANVREYLPEGYEDSFMAPVTFGVVKRFIPTAADGIAVVAINSTTDHKLEYSHNRPRKIIAIGGNRLSRGFTIRGLTINYFIRATNYSDTLLQMGRWFGYRPGYIDCCRLFTTTDSIEKFNSTTRCVEELEIVFKKMHDEGKSPNNFLIRVRKDPGVLQITRPSILENTTTVKWSFQDQLEMTTKFDVSKEKIERVWQSFRDNTAPLFQGHQEEDDLFFRTELKGESIIEFLRKPNNFDSKMLEAMIKFIELCQQERKLTNWTIALKRKGQSKRPLEVVDSNLPFATQMVIRNGPSIEARNSHNRHLFLTQKIFRASGQSANIVSSPLDLAVTLKPLEIAEAEKEFKEQKLKKMLLGGMTREEAELNLRKKTIPERVYRERLPETDGLLIIYLFDSYHSFNQSDAKDNEFAEFVRKGNYDLDIPLVGYAIGFPPITNDPGGIYVHGDYDPAIDEEDVDADDLSVPNDGMEA